MYPAKFRSFLIPTGGVSSFEDDLLRGFMSPLFQSDRVSTPAVNVKENDENFFIELSVPGRDKADFNIRIEGKRLIVSSEKEEHIEAQEGKINRREFKLNAFTRSFHLPETIQRDAIHAAYVEGILRITLPKEEKTRENKHEIAVH